MEASILAALDDADRRRVLQRTTRLRFARNAYVFHAGDAGDSVHLIDKGRVAVQAGGALGEPITLTVLAKGDVFGEQALLAEDHLRTATIQALELTETLMLRRADFEDLRRSFPSVDRFLVAVLARQVRRLTAQITEMAEVAAPVRVYRRLASLAEVFDAAGPGGEIPITQNQLASMAGVSLRLANKVVGEARAAGLLDTANRRIVVRNWDALVARCRTSGPSAAFL